ncbi:MAG: adenylate/guanylate cyclase domain-containing protein [Magnetovibrionaceae bacterium]
MWTCASKTALDEREQRVAETFRNAERAGLKLAIRGRWVALFLMALWFLVSRQADPGRVVEFLAVIGVFAALGGLHYALIGSRFDLFWVKYLFLALDVALLSALMATQPIYDSVDVPQVISFRASNFPFFFIILAIAAFSFSPGLVLFAGAVGVTGWLGAFFVAVKDMPVSFDWSDIGINPTTEVFYSMFLSPFFIGTGSRVQEAIAFMVVALLIAIVMMRARLIVRRQLELDEEQRALREVFGRFVPESVAKALISDRGALEPVERQATVLFADLEGFTDLTSRKEPQQLVQLLNAYFDGAARIIADHKGVITQFQGDAILATFNVPLEDPDHAGNAYRAAMALFELVGNGPIEGEVLNIRIGLSTGPLVAGTVGGGGRESYTVHGDTVNLAARLEALNKEYGTRLLASELTVKKIEGENWISLGGRKVRGLQGQTEVFTIGRKGEGREA